jgi:hypothetical protein
MASGTVTTTTPSGATRAVPADIFFEATGICRYETNGAEAVLDTYTPGFSFSRQVTTTNGAYSVQLPLGQYRVTIVPSDATSALETVDGFQVFQLSNGHCQPPAKTPPLSVQAQLVVKGTAIVADQRPLANAIAEAVPTKCSDGSVDPVCLPRPARAIVAADGTYSLSLDPGAYLLRVRPADGTRLPWVVQPMTVDPSTTMSPPTAVPAPVYVGLQLVDPNGNPMQDAVVRVYQTPTMVPPFEIGAAITDGNGHFDMYLAPSAQ